VGTSERADRNPCPNCGRQKQVAKPLCYRCRPTPRADVVRNCAECGTSFAPYRYASQQRHCSIACAARAGLRHAFKPREKTCTECGRSFLANHALRMRCSDACEKAAARARHQPKTRQCRFCGVEFVPRRGRCTCSSACALAYKRSVAAHWHQQNYRTKKGKAAAINPFVTKECSICGDRFEVNFCAARRLYCSPRCARRAERRHRLTLGGTSYYLGRDTPEEFRETCRVLQQLRQLVAERTS